MWAWEEEMLGECRNLLSNIVFQPNVVDQWVWRHDPGGGYTVQGTYNLITSREFQDAEATSDLIWHKQVPLKVSVLALRLLRNRLPTKDNLLRRHVVTTEIINT
ncbi:helicase-like protein [Trifolium medium]|uniref:Helicase-like protein n=1 Tax=Trifolium medium TaxID=97028 RepID=A0A392RUN5_9FABA|nr:helicase-like protein [Trifolium medium]